MLESRDHIGHIKMLSSICSREIVHLDILQSDWLRRFWPLSQKQDFSHIKIKIFNINTVKINDQIFH